LERSELLAALRASISKALLEGNPAKLLSDHSMGLAEELAPSINWTTDFDDVFALAIFHWLRGASAPGDAVATDRAVAQALLAAVSQTDPRGVPEGGGGLAEPDTTPEPESAAERDELQDETNRAIELVNSYSETHDAASLRNAVNQFRAVAAASPEDHPDHAAHLSNLATALSELSGVDGALDLLVEAKETAKAAWDAASTDTPEYGGPALSAYGTVLQALFTRTGDRQFLDEAVKVSRAAINDQYLDLAGRVRELMNLAITLAQHHERSGDASTLGEAVGAARAALSLVPAGHPDHSQYAMRFSIILFHLVERTGDLGLANEAAGLLRTALADDHFRGSERAEAYTTLGVTLRKIFELGGDSGILFDAVEAARASVENSDRRDIRYSGRVNNVGTCLARLYERTGDIGILEQAVERFREAVETSSHDLQEHALHTANLGGALGTLYARANSPEVGHEAVDVNRAALAQCPPEGAERSLALTNLGILLSVLGSREQDTAVSAEAIDVLQEVAAATPPEHAELAMRQHNLGNALADMYRRDNQRRHLDEAASCYLKAAGNAGAPTAVRFNAHMAHVRLMQEDARESGEILAELERAVALLPQLSTRTLSHSDREDLVARLLALPALVAAAAVDAGKPARAIELLEQTRGVLVADFIDARSSDLTLLREHDTDLANAFIELRARRERLDNEDSSPLPGSSEYGTAPMGDNAYQKGLELARTRRGAQAEWDELLSTIRSRPGLENFLHPPGITELTGQAASGPIVFVYASEVRCDALIVSAGLPGSVDVVPLKNVSHEQAVHHAEALGAAIAVANDTETDPARRMASQGEILAILSWMWDAICGPIVRRLQLSGTSADERQWPRIWWCPIGVMSTLPLHAAGHHRNQDEAEAARPAEAVMDLAVSSYIPTIRGLAYSRRRSAEPSAGAALIVAVPDAPGLPPLPGVVDETGRLTSIIPQARVLPHPTAASVLNALPDCPIVHFACHGITEPDDPSASRLLLYDHETSPLGVRDISALHLSGSLAFLSACSTTSVGPYLMDESVHITGAFHLAGYKHVIGTLWPIFGFTARQTAVRFYSLLADDHAVSLNSDHAATSLHRTIRELRSRYVMSPTVWAAYIHTGP